MYLENHYKNNIVYISSKKDLTLEKELLQYNTDILHLATIPVEIEDWIHTPDAILFIDPFLENWKLEWEKAKKLEVLKDIPCLLLANNRLKKNDLLVFLQQGLYGCIFNDDFSVLASLCISACVHGKKIKEQQLKTNDLNRMVSTSYLIIDAKNVLLENIKRSLDKLTDKEKVALKDVKIIANEITQKIKEEYHYQLFKIHFEEVHPLFYKKLLKLNNSLTDHNLKLLAFLKMGFNNNEISFLLNISIAAVKKSIQRLKPKLGLMPKDSIRERIFTL